MYPFTFSYLIYEAERQRSAADQREADVRAGELAASIAKIGHAVKAAVTRRAGGNRLQEPAMAGDDLIPVGKCRDGFCPSRLTAVPAQPAPRTAG